MTQPTATTCDARPTTDQAPRDAARQLADQGVSNREIGRRLGVSEATVRRWRKADAPPTRDDAPADAVTVVPDDDLRAALDVLAEAGLSAPAALRQCALFVAGAVAHGWEQQAFPRGVVPPMQVEFIAPHPEPVGQGRP